MENNFEILERTKDDVQIIEIKGELDAFVAPKIKETLSKLIENEVNKYIIDFKGLIHINSLAMWWITSNPSQRVSRLHCCISS